MINEKHLPLVGASIGIGVDVVQDFQKLKLGNVVLTTLPDDAEEAKKVMRYCRENGIYVMLSEIIRRETRKRWHSPSLSKEQLEAAIKEGGDYFLGRYAIGECGGLCYWPKSYTYEAAVGAYRNLPPCDSESEAHKEFVEHLHGELEYERKEICDCPLFNVESSILFSYLTEAGIDGHCLELLPGDPLITLSALRGAALAQKSLWGVHIAMLWYGGVQMDELWLKRWKASLWLCFMTGAQFIYPESGYFDFYGQVGPKLPFDSPEMRRTRRELRQLSQFTQIHTRPAGVPRTPVAIVQGQDDGHPGIWNPYAWGIYEQNGDDRWETSDAERGWELYNAIFTKDTAFDVKTMGAYDASGNPPCGQIDIIPPGDDFSRYHTLIFMGYNRMDEALYRKLCDYVSAGGHLLLWLSHFDTADHRGAELKLFRDGKLAELCGFNVLGRGRIDVHEIKYVEASSLLEYEFPVWPVRRDPMFICRTEAADIQLATASAKVLAGYSYTHVAETVETVQASPLVVEHRLGKGVVFTVATYTKPGTVTVRPFAEHLVRTMLKAAREDWELVTPSTVRWAVYDLPGVKDGRLFYLFNTDPDCGGGVRLVHQGSPVGHSVYLPENEFALMYLLDGVRISPTDSRIDLVSAVDDKVQFVTAEQNLELENLSGAARTMVLNGQTFQLAAHERRTCRVAANIPENMRGVFAVDYLDEPEVKMRDLSTPY